MKFDKVQFVYIDMDYLKKLNEIEPEIFFDAENKNYKDKPHLGILLNNEGREYVIPLTSAKEKHKTWDDVTASWYRIYEIIEMSEIRENDIIVDIKNRDVLNRIPLEEQENYKQRILAVLDIRKMFPVKKEVYTKIKFEISTKVSQKENQRMALMMKEYSFILNISDKIAEKASKIYKKQIEKNKVLKYHCDYRKLEKFVDEYK
ncbi:MAG: type III toxin-antitoxin system ToxN/AbiQ family toxin [Agathobacter sp.]|nr:type III toxin-antitoxin system ToxN/AbiQ family toxin [Agathobacter sp.]